MMQVNIHQAKTHFSKLIKRVLNGEEITIAKGNKPIAKLVPMDSRKSKRELGTAKGKIQLSPDFDEPLSDFEEDMP